MTSQQFKQIRKQLGRTQAELAEIMGTTPQSISRIERGERKPTKIMAAFIQYIEKKQQEAQMYGFSTKIYNDGKAQISGVIWVPEGSKNTTSSKSRFDLYFDVFNTEEEANQARNRALAEA